MQQPQGRPGGSAVVVASVGEVKSDISLRLIRDNWCILAQVNVSAQENS